MAHRAPIYDLMLLLATESPDEQRSKVLADVERIIAAAGGEIERNDNWGRRPTAFQIRHKADAEYHLLQFTAPPQLIDELSHTLRITDGVLRFRVIKVRPGTPAAPSSPPPVVAAAAAFSSGPSPASPPQAPAAEPEPAPAAAAASAGGAPAAASAGTTPPAVEEAAANGAAGPAEEAGEPDAGPAE